MSYKLKFLQLNCHHCKTNIDYLNSFIIENNIDIALLQEVIVSQGKVTGYKKYFKIFNSTNPNTAIIINNVNIDAILISQCSDKNTCVVEVTLGSQKLILISAYFDISTDIDIDICKIRKILQIYRNHAIVIGVDSNSRSAFWHDVKTNSRGRKLEEFIISENLALINLPSKLSTFHGGMGKSNIDLTICNITGAKIIRNWKINDDTNFSDHRTLSYDIMNSTSTQIITLAILIGFT